MDAIGVALSKTIANIYEVQALQVFIETLIVVFGSYILYRIIKMIISYRFTRKRSRSISSSSEDIEVLNTV